MQHAPRLPGRPPLSQYHSASKALNSEVLMGSGVVRSLGMTTSQRGGERSGGPTYYIVQGLWGELRDFRKAPKITVIGYGGQVCSFGRGRNGQVLMALVQGSWLRMIFLPFL